MSDLAWLKPDDWGSFWYGFVGYPIIVAIVCVIAIVILSLMSYFEDDDC